MDNISGIILAGGKSSRLGQNKALIEFEGKPIVQHVVDVLRPLVDEIVLATNTPESFAFLKLRMVADLYAETGALGGLHAGLSAIQSEYGLVVGCDMPFLNTALLQHMLLHTTGYDIVMPHIDDYYEPLHAIYARRCLAVIEHSIQSGQRRLLSFVSQMNVRYIKGDEIDRFDPQRLAFFNLNSPDDLKRMYEIASWRCGQSPS
ncbi:MAG: molybdenum cofactor guanylyltransferase [Anaerolineae bacterium]|nr:molybdenum cofactor guanylyltransferase [Anaerolineae bacterium]